MLGTTTDAESYRRAAKDSWSTFIRARFDAGPAGRSGRIARIPQLEAELELMHEFLAVAKQHVNACSSAACSLPTEVLAIIFAFAQESWRPKRIKTKKMHDLGWIHATHVCADWRNAALGTHTLWQKVDCIALPASMATEILTRSGRLPLQLYARTAYNTKVADLVETWLSGPALRRASLLHIDDNYHYAPGHDIKIWLQTLNQPMPFLQDLAITLMLEDEPEPLPEGFLKNTQPALTRLYLRNCHLPNWTSAILGHTVTEMSLHTDWMYGESGSYPTVTELRAIFSRLTSLRLLSLKDFYPKSEANTIEPFTFYTSLESFTFHFSLPGVYESHYHAFWAVFRVPATTSFKLWAYADGEFDADVEGFVDPITRIDNATLPAKELVIDDLNLTLWYTGTSSVPLSPPFDRLDVEHSRSAITRTICSTNSAPRYHVPVLPLESLSSISVTQDAMLRFNKPEPDGGWLSKLGAAREVRRISVYYPHCQLLLDDLLSRDTYDKFLLFPLLDTIVFHYELWPNEKTRQTRLGLVLLELLANRYEHGAPIRELLVDCRMEGWFIWSKVDREKTKLTFFTP
ncbi:hypothetical protein PENSPDRAFT_751081 [Peniophora sp. CONT]|nr:hypothetical protein PENSPDRAFT_751081 [Peniophora sp. CONT]